MWQSQPELADSRTPSRWQTLPEAAQTTGAMPIEGASFVTVSDYFYVKMVVMARHALHPRKGQVIKRDATHHTSLPYQLNQLARRVLIVLGIGISHRKLLSVFSDRADIDFQSASMAAVRRKRSAVGKADVANTDLAILNGSLPVLEMKNECKHSCAGVLPGTTTWRSIRVIESPFRRLRKYEVSSRILNWNFPHVGLLYQAELHYRVDSDWPLRRRTEGKPYGIAQDQLSRIRPSNLCIVDSFSGNSQAGSAQ